MIFYSGMDWIELGEAACKYYFHKKALIFILKFMISLIDGHDIADYQKLKQEKDKILRAISNEEATH